MNKKTVLLYLCINIFIIFTKKLMDIIVKNKTTQISIDEVFIDIKHSHELGDKIETTLLRIKTIDLINHLNKIINDSRPSN